MAAKVEIILEARDESSGILRGITSQFGQFGTMVEQVTGTSINWGNVLASATSLAIDGFKAAMKATTEYAEEVRDLSLVAGVTAEEASRLIQVLDDYQLTTQDAMTATRKLTANGLAPTIETIAELSDEYRSLNTAQEKNKFLLDNFGRSGSEWVNLLNQGGEAILRLNENIDENLILTEQSISDAERYRLGLDAWNDAVLALQISIGSRLLPTLADMTQGLANSNAIREEANRLISEGLATNRQEALQMASTTVAANNMADAIENSGDAAAGTVPDYQKQISMMKQLTGATLEQINATAFMLLQQQLAADGIVSEEDFALLIDAGVAMGQFDQSAGYALQSIGALNEQLANGTITIEEYIAFLEGIPAYITTEVHTVYTEEGEPPIYPSTLVQQSSSPQEYFGDPGTEYVYPDNKSAETIMGTNPTMAGNNIFYGNVTITSSSKDDMGILEYR